MGVIAERALVRTGALNEAVKTEPLPVGYYWIDVFDDSQNSANIATFHDWIELHHETVSLEAEEEYNASADWNIFETEPHRIWALFQVKSPTRWDQSLSLGWPNEAHKGMVSGDTIQKPDPEPTIFDEGFEWPTWLKWTVGGVVVVAGGALIISVIRR